MQEQDVRTQKGWYFESFTITTTGKNTKQHYALQTMMQQCTLEAF